MGETANTHQSVIDADLTHSFHSWSTPNPLKLHAIGSGAGSTVWDVEGNEYLDFSLQLGKTKIGCQHRANSEATSTRSSARCSRWCACSDSKAYGLAGFRFFSQEAAVTSRWLDPSHGGINLSFSQK